MCWCVKLPIFMLVAQFHALLQYPDAITATTAKTVSKSCQIHLCKIIMLLWFVRGEKRKKDDTFLIIACSCCTTLVNLRVPMAALIFEVFSIAPTVTL